MRRLLAVGAAAAVMAFGAACADDADQNNAGEGDQAQPEAQPLPENTAQVCAGAESAQANQISQFETEMAEITAEDLPEEEFEQEALGAMERAISGWSEGLAEQAELAEDPELASALTDLSDGLSDAAGELTVESVRTGEIPGAEQLDEYGATLTAICYPNATPSPGQ